MKLKLLLATLLAIFTANIYAAKAYHFIDCFTKIELKMDNNNNIFAFFHNNHISRKCRDLRYTPFNYFSMEIYRLSHDEASKIYQHLNTYEYPISIEAVFNYLKQNKISCFGRGESLLWPFIAYYGCVPTKVIS